jgi:cation transport ATPase
MRAADAWLLCLAASTLVVGLLCLALGYEPAARLVWSAGVLPVLLALSVAIVQSLKRREAGIDLLAWLAIALAMSVGESLTAAVIALMLASGRALERFAEQRAQREITALLRHAPREATRYQGGEWHRVDLDTIVAGDRLLVRAGDTVPVDGSLAGHAQLDESALTGEPAIQLRTPGEPLRSGVLNAGAAFEMIAAASACDSTFAGIVRMVEAARRERSPAARLADRYALGFVLATLVLAAASWAVTHDVMRVLAVLVVATPCPLILAVSIAPARCFSTRQAP